MKWISLVIFTLTTAAVGAAPVNTFALVVGSPGSARTVAGAVHSGQRLSASSDLSVPADSTPVDLQLTGDATFATSDSSPMTASASESLVRVEPGSALSLSKLEAVNTGIGTVRQINLQLTRGSVLVSARRLPEPSSFNLLASAGRVSIAEGTVKVSPHSIAVAAGRAVFFPNGTDSKDAHSIILTSGHAYDMNAHALSRLSPEERSAMERQAAEFHPVGPAHFFSDDDYTEDCISPIHPGEGHHPHPPHHPKPPHESHHPHPWPTEHFPM